MSDLLLSHWKYFIVVLLMMIGLFIVISSMNLVKKLIGLSLFQTSVFLLYISLGKIESGTAPIIMKSGHDGHGNMDILYSNPLPHVLILTAIVVGVATTALGLALVLRIKASFNSIEEDEILNVKRAIDSRSKSS
jgi:multicomponent Na+:H+ antiporter subunit C